MSTIPAQLPVSLLLLSVEDAPILGMNFTSKSKSPFLNHKRKKKKKRKEGKKQRSKEII